MRTSGPAKIAVLDDYQGMSLQMADWSTLVRRANITVFRNHLSDPTAVVDRLRPFDVVCVMRERTPLPGSVLERLPNLRLIVSTGPTNPSIDLAAAKTLGITVCHTRQGSGSVAELTWALILGIMRHVVVENASVRRGGWQVSVGADVRGKTLGILGLGRIGGRVAKVARAFEMEVIAWSQNLTRERAEENGARLAGKDELFRTADIVTIHLALSDRTIGIVGAHELRLMKPTAYLVNTSRGPLVAEEALVNALRNRTIAGAALDVYGMEPLPETHPFRSLDNVLATPHIGFVTRDTYETYYRDMVEDIIAWLDGNPVRVLSL